jgi:GAF domain-containing protein
MARALPLAERVSSVETMLANETAETLQLTSGAVFRASGGVYARTASMGWEGAAEELDADDSLVLFARSERRGVQLSVAPPSRARVPHGNAEPIFALPVIAGRNTIAVVLYGGHRDGEAIDNEEEQLLNALAHAAATAYEHLHAEERERENLALREQLKRLGAAYP